MMIRTVINGDEYNEKAIKLALGHLMGYAENCTELILYCNTKRQLIENTVIAEILSERVCNALRKVNEQRITIDNSNVTLVFKTDTTIKKTSLKGKAILVLYADMKMMNQVDKLCTRPDQEPTGIITMPVEGGALNDWCDRWNPTVYDDNNIVIKQASGELIEDMVVISTINNILTMIHTKTLTGFSNNDDKRHTKKCFGVLRKKGHFFDPNAIKNWIIADGYTPEFASEVADIAKKVKNLKNNPTIPKDEVNDLYQHLKKNITL